MLTAQALSIVDRIQARDPVDVRFARPDEAKAVEAFAAQFPEVKDFVFTWRRWGNWEPHPPIIMVRGGEVHGFHAVTFSARGLLMNSYYIAVSEAMRARGAVVYLADFMFRVGHKRGMKRFKTKAKADAGGKWYWESFGMRPFARELKEHPHYLFNHDVGPVKDARSCIEWMQLHKLHAPIPFDQMRRYRKGGIELL